MQTRAATTRIFVHHTCTSRMNTTREQIYNEHVKGRGWSDIGYHFIISGDGHIILGRDERLALLLQVPYQSMRYRFHIVQSSQATRARRR